MHAFLFTQSGIPVLYSGDEIAQLNDYTYHDDPLKREDSRYLHRGSMNWDDAKKRKKKNTVQNRMFSAIRKLEQIHNTHKVFDNSADIWVVETYNDHVLGIGRYKDREKLIALFNFSNYDETAWINESEPYIDLMTGQPREAKAVGVLAGDFAWLYTVYPEASTMDQEPEAE